MVMLNDVRISCWNVGHGEATIMSSQDTAHIIDFGSTALPKRYGFTPINVARKIIQQHGKVTVTITHFHYDHYSLIPHVVESKTIDAVFIPVIPSPKPITKMVCYLLVVQEILLRQSGQAVLNDIAKKARRAYFVYRGVSFRLTNGLRMHILWPPLQLSPDIARKVMQKLEPAYEKAKKLVEKAKIAEQVSSKAEELYEEIGSVIGRIQARDERTEAVEASNGVLSSLPTLIKIEVLKEGLRLSTEELKLLDSIRDALNDMSLVLKYYYRGRALALIPGDNSDKILDYISLLQRNEQVSRRRVIFLRGSHHGTYFGKYLEETKAAVTWLSWTSALRRPLHPGYLSTALITAVAEHVRELHLTLRLHHLLYRLYLDLVVSHGLPYVFHAHTCIFYI